MKDFFTVICYHDVELKAGARDTLSTCTITVMLMSSSKAVCQHTDVCIIQLSYCSMKLLSLLLWGYDCVDEREGCYNV